MSTSASPAATGSVADHDPERRDPEATRKNILEIATEEFADKEGLFVAVIEQAYGRIRQIEAALKLDHLEPEAALRTLVGFTFDYQNANEAFIRLVMVENIHKGVHLARSGNIEELNLPVIATLHDIYRRGLNAGVFRDGIDEIDLHMSISALCFFNVANRATFSRIFKREMASPDALARRREIVIDTIMRYVKKTLG